MNPNISNALAEWFTPFAFYFLTLTTNYFLYLLALRGLDYGKTAFWDDLCKKYRAFLLSKSIKVSKDNRIVQIKGGNTDSELQQLQEFTKYYKLLLAAQRNINLILLDKGKNIVILIVTSFVFATFSVIIWGSDFQLGAVAAYFVPSAIAACFLHYYPVHVSHVKIKEFLEEKEKEEKHLMSEHGLFQDI